MIREAAAILLDFIYPPHCQGCAREGEWFCDICRERVLRVVTKVEVPQGFTNFYHVGKYSDPAIRSLVHAIKYRGASCVSDSLRKLLADYMRTHVLFESLLADPGLVIYHVPSDEIRIRERGIDHGSFLANALATAAPGVRVSKALVKRRRILANASLPSNDARKGNTRGAFAMMEPAAAKCLLIDDVYTTGATFSACKEALRSAGAKEIHGFVLAKG